MILETKEGRVGMNDTVIELVCKNIALYRFIFDCENCKINIIMKASRFAFVPKGLPKSQQEEGNNLGQGWFG